MDDNDRALQELDITLLKPHPEWRNVAAGPIWGKNDEYYELLWKHWLEEPSVKKFQILQDKDWEDYVEKYGETPIDYINSDDYKDKYEGKETWINYVRNHKCGIPPQKTRKTCMNKDGTITTGSPCPLCRDERLLITYNNLPLLIQYIDQQTGLLHSNLRTGLCRIKQKRLVWCHTIAQELGYLHRIVPFVKFNLKNYEHNAHVL